MGYAIEEAKLAMEEGEVPVGSILLSSRGDILGRGHNASIQTHDISAHAEIMALRHAGSLHKTCRFPDAVLLVTLEPCAMCAAAIVQARLAGIVYGARDALAGAVVSRVEYLDAPCVQGSALWHLGGVRSHECAQLLQTFFSQCRHGEQGGIHA